MLSNSGESGHAHQPKDQLTGPDGGLLTMIGDLDTAYAANGIKTGAK